MSISHCAMMVLRIKSFVVFLLLSLCWVPIQCWSPTANTSRGRRYVLQEFIANSGLASIFFLTGTPAAAEENPSQDETSTSRTTSQKPSAPIDRLVPAARVKWTIDKATRLAESSNPDWSQLQSLLLQPQNYTHQLFPEVPSAPAKAYLDTYQRNRQQLNLLAQPGAFLVQSGEIAAWKRLKQQERQREEQDEIRAALNLYTSALSFRADSYLLNVPPAERKQMIRNDRLPDVKQVIQSDLGVRYLLRNELLTIMDQVKAELEYQVEQQPKPTVDELVLLLQQAQSACNQWFALIEEQDVLEAMKIVQQEKEGF